MPTPKHRSRSLRKVFKKLPGGRLGIHYERKRPKRAHCASCGRALHGVPRGLPYEFKHISKTQRRPERIYGGVMCGNCTRDILISNARSKK